MHNYFEILLPLGLILLLSKTLSVLCKKLGLPQVVGMLTAGLLLGLIRYIPNQIIFTIGIGTSDGTIEGLSFIAKIGVILIMFSAGIETDLKQFKKVGFPSIVITSFGVIFPLGLGFLAATIFNGGFSAFSQNIYDNLFYGAILAATSVSITVAALKEMGKLNTKVGSSIVAAAILDDIIGVVLLSLFIGLKQTGSGADVLLVIIKTLGFFVTAIIAGILLRKLFKIMEDKWAHRRRIPIFAFAACFLFAYIAEKFFGVADITGAYFAGLILSGLNESEYIDTKIEVSNYMLFAPVFFANIGITTTFAGLDARIVGFGIAFIAAGLIGKILGAGIAALFCKYSFVDSLRVGIGMMARAEVVLVCTQKGIDFNMVSPSIMPFVLILIIISSFMSPLFLKMTYKNEIGQSMLTPLIDLKGCLIEGTSEAVINLTNSPSQTETDNK